MGRSSRPKPAHLADKLLRIRTSLGLSQNGMLQHLGLKDTLIREHISAFERGVREPPLPVLLRYARAAGVWVDILIDDELDLPKKLPCTPRHEGVAHKISTRSRRKD